MGESGRKLRHLQFFEELSRLPEGDPGWRAITAGLVVLRLLDAWTVDPATASGDSWSVRAVRASIDEVPPELPERAILASVLEAILAARPGEMHQVAPRLLAYGRTLEHEGRWSLAADVYQTVIGYTHPAEDTDIAIAANLQLGRSLRSLGELSMSETAYRAAGRLAERSDDVMSILLARLGEAKAAFARGNMPVAERLLDETIARASGERLQRVRAMALHDRAGVAYTRGDYQLTVRLAYDALELSTDALERDRVLADIAATFVQLGALGAARDAYTVLALTAQQQWVRWMSTLNLMDIAGREGAQPTFERLRRELAEADLPPYIETSYHLFAGQGYSRFGRVKQAREHLGIALRLAEQHTLNTELFEAEAALRALDEPVRAAPTAVSVPLSDEVQAVADGISGMRARVAAAT